MFGGKNPFFDRADPRLRSIPFPTRRATQKEVQRVWLCLASIQLLGEFFEMLLNAVQTSDKLNSHFLDENDTETKEGTAGIEKLTINESFEDQSSSDSEKIDEINLKLPRRGKKKPKNKIECQNIGSESIPSGIAKFIDIFLFVRRRPAGTVSWRKGTLGIDHRSNN